MNRLSILVIAICSACGDDSAPGTGDSGPGRLDGGPGSSDAGASVDASGSTDAGDVDGGGGDTDAGATTDAGTSGVPCGDVTCGAEQRCCTTLVPGGEPMTECVGAEERCEGIAIACDGPEDCDGDDVCCLGGIGPGGGGGARCGPADRCPSIACHDAEDCPETDGRPLMCCPFELGPVSGSRCAPLCERMTP
jgi:hypothetical protein